MKMGSVCPRCAKCIRVKNGLCFGLIVFVPYYCPIIQNRYKFKI